MKKILILALAISMIAGLSIAASADIQTCSCAHVQVTVAPNVSMGAEPPFAQPTPIQTGKIETSIPFRVDANNESVCFFVEASNLFKGDDPTSTAVAPIPLDGPPCVAPTNANPIGTTSKILEWNGVGRTIQGFPTQKTVSRCYESSQNNRFSQDVVVTVKWCQNDPEKPQGIYSGVVCLTSFLTL